MATTTKFEEALAAVGGVKAVHRMLGDAERRDKLLISRMPRLVKEHPDQWVAIVEGDEMIFAPTHDELLVKVRAAGKPTNNAVFEFLNPKPKTMIL